MAETYRIVKKSKKVTYKNGSVCEYSCRYKIQKKYWLGWFTPMWYKWDTMGEWITNEWEAKDKLNGHLANKGSVVKRTKEVVETIETE